MIATNDPILNFRANHDPDNKGESPALRQNGYVPPLKSPAALIPLAPEPFIAISAWTSQVLISSAPANWASQVLFSNAPAKNALGSKAKQPFLKQTANVGRPEGTPNPSLDQAVSLAPHRPRSRQVQVKKRGQLAEPQFLPAIATNSPTGSSYPMAAAQDTVPTTTDIKTEFSGTNVKISAVAPASNFLFGLKSDGQIGQIGPSFFGQTADNLLDQWQRQMTFKGELLSENGFSFKFDGTIDDRRRIYGQNALGLLFGRSDKWEENTVVRSKFQIGALEERIQYTLQYAWSNFTGSSAYLNELTKKSKKGKAQFWDQDRTEGNAISQRVNLRILEFNKDLGVTVFGEHRVVGPSFHAYDNKKKDIFDNKNYEDLRYGMILDLGPAELTLGRVQSQRVDSVYLRKTLYAIKLALDLEKLGDFFGNSGDHPIWSHSPQFIWVSFSNGRIKFEDGDLAPEDETADFSVGASWYRGKGNIDISYWQSFYGGRQIGSENSDWMGNGIEFGYGLNDDWWSFGGQLSLDRYVSLDKFSNNTEYNNTDYSLGGSFWLALEPEDLPAFTTTVSWGRYTSKYLYTSIDYNDGSSGQSDYWEASAALDFSGYLPQRSQYGKPRLDLLYILQGNNYREENVTGAGETASENTHIFAVRFDTRF